MSTYRLRSTAWLGHAKAPKQKQIVSRRSLGTETGNSSSTSLCNFIFAVQSTPTPRIRLSFSCSRRRCFVREQCFRFPKKSALQVAEHKAESECCLCAFLHCVCCGCCVFQTGRWKVFRAEQKHVHKMLQICSLREERFVLPQKADQPMPSQVPGELAGRRSIRIYRERQATDS